MMRNKTALIVTCALLVTALGCATSGAQYASRGVDILTKSTSFIGSVKEIQYQPLVLGESETFDFDEQTTILQEGSKRFFVKGFFLPNISAPYSITVVSYRQGTVNDPAIMYPDVKLLDDQYRTIREIPSDSFRFRPAIQADGLSAVIFINGTKPDARYLLVSNRIVGEDEQITAQSNITSAVMVGWYAYPKGISTAPTKIRASAIGRMKVDLQEYRLKKVGE